MRWIRALEKLGFLISAGSACSTGKASVSATLLAMGIDPVVAGRALRISSGVNTMAEDWQALQRAMVVANSLLDAEASAGKSTVISLD
jgi:cysteine desulfurase